MMASRPRRPGRLRREAFGVRRIPALSFRAVRNSHTAPEYGALQTLRAVRLQETRPEKPLISANFLLSLGLFLLAVSSRVKKYALFHSCERVNSFVKGERF